MEPVSIRRPIENLTIAGIRIAAITRAAIASNSCPLCGIVLGAADAYERNGRLMISRIVVIAAGGVCYPDFGNAVPGAPRNLRREAVISVLAVVERMEKAPARNANELA
jgi:hypothetical protein